MKARTLITHRLYFGMDAMKLRTASAQVISRVVGLSPERARVSARSLRQDFGVDTVQGKELVEQFVTEGLLEPPRELQVDYGLTERFLEFASARVVDPLPRERAKQLLAHACELAARVNGDWARNPLEIEAIAPFGCYMSRDRQLAELPLGIVVRTRPAARRARWGRIQTKGDGAREIRAQFRDLSSFIHVRMVSDTRRLPRPFAFAFHADSPALVASLSSHPA